MRYLDRAFCVAVALFLLGAFLGATMVLTSTTFQGFVLRVLQFRMVSPVQAANRLGDVALFFLVFANNSVPVVLSFAYSLVILRVRWTPPLSEQRTWIFMSLYTLIVAFLAGFFSVGATVAVGWVNGGGKVLSILLSTSWIHGPLEVVFVLRGVAEPLRIVWGGSNPNATPNQRLSEDVALLCICLLGLCVSAAIEVFAKL
jgi:hypothetical protein